MVDAESVSGAGWCRRRRGRRGNCGHDVFVVREGLKVGIRLDAQLNATDYVGPGRTWILFQNGQEVDELLDGVA